MKNQFVIIKYLLVIGFIITAFTLHSHAQNPVSLSMSVDPAKAKPGDKLTAQIQASIDGGWYMYSITQGGGGPIPTTIRLSGDVFKPAGAIRGTEPKRKMDPNFNMMTEYYSGSASFSIPVTVDAGAEPGTQTLTAKVRYQVCNDKICLPPKSVNVTAPVQIVAASVAAEKNTPAPTLTPTPIAAPPPTAAPDKVEEANAGTNSSAADIQDNTAATSETPPHSPPPFSGTESFPSKEIEQINSASQTSGDNKPDDLWLFIGLAMTVGALTLLTPCVFPMIPITVSYFTNHAAGDRPTAIRDASIYALGIILTFTALGVALAFIFGAAGINKFAASPYVNLLITTIFLAFALSLFGAFEIRIPSNILTKLDALQRREECKSGAGRIVALLLMGLIFSLTSFTCTAPFVGTLLVMAAQGDWFMPVIGMLAFSTVFALPFFLLALAPQLMSQLPKSGGWLNTVKVVMGLLEVAAAMKFLSNVDMIWGWDIFKREVVLASWVAITLVIGVYLLGVFKLSLDTSTERIGPIRLLSAVLFLSVGLYFLTGLYGARLGEIESFLPPPTENSLVAAKSKSKNAGENGGELDWIKNDYNAALLQAKKENKPIFIDFTGYTCTNCRWMEANMFPKKSVKSELEKYVRVQLYTDGEGEPYEGFQKMQEAKFGTVALPLYAVVNAASEKILTFEGLTRKEDEFVSFLQSGQAKFASVAVRNLTK